MKPLVERLKKEYAGKVEFRRYVDSGDPVGDNSRGSSTFNTCRRSCSSMPMQPVGSLVGGTDYARQTEARCAEEALPQQLTGTSAVAFECVGMDANHNRKRQKALVNDFPAASAW
jgi:hypothetical protein